jgi:hypothetical protein
VLHHRIDVLLDIGLLRRFVIEGRDLLLCAVVDMGVVPIGGAGFPSAATERC